MERWGDREIERERERETNSSIQTFNYTGQKSILLFYFIVAEFMAQ